MNRRDFIKQSLAAAIGLSLPMQLGTTLTIVNVELLDSFKDIMTLGKSRVENGQWLMEVCFDSDKIWTHVKLVDDQDREWHTDDNGQTWHHGLMSFGLNLA